jgi:hypothetical protein
VSERHERDDADMMKNSQEVDAIISYRILNET